MRHPVLVCLIVLIGSIWAAGQDISPTSEPKRDGFGDLLPSGAVARLGTRRLSLGEALVGITVRDDNGLLAVGVTGALASWTLPTGSPVGEELLLEGDDWVTSISSVGAFGPIVLSTWGGTIITLDAGGGARRWDSKGRAYSAEVSRSAERVFVGHWNRISTYTLEGDNELVLLAGDWGETRALRVSSDGTMLVFLDQGGTTHVAGLQNGAFGLRSSVENTTFAAFLGDTTRLVFGSPSRVFMSKNLADPARGATAVEITSAVCFEALSESQLVIGTRTGEVWSWNTAQPELRLVFRAPAGVVDIESVGGSSVAIATLAGVVELVDVRTGSKLFERNGHAGAALSLTVTNRGKKLVSASETEILQWDVDELARRGDSIAGCAPVSACLDGDAVVFASRDSEKLELRNLSMNEERSVVIPIGRASQHMVVASEGAYVAVGHMRNYRPASRDDGGFRGATVYDLVAPRATKTLDVGDVSAVALHGGTRRLATGGWESLDVWSLPSGARERRVPLSPRSGWVRAASFSPEGEYLAASLADRVVVWRTMDWREHRSAYVDEPSYGALDFSDRRRILVGMGDGRVRLIGLVPEVRHREWSLGSGTIHSIASIGDGARAGVACDDGTILILAVGE